MKIIQYRKIWFTISAILVAAALYGIFVQGLNLGVDFRGGSITEIRYEAERPEKSEVESAVAGLGFGAASIRPSEDDRYIIRTRELKAEEGAALLAALTPEGGQVPVLERFNTVGPLAGAQLQRKAMIAVAVVVLMIVLFVTFAFRHVSKPVASWKYGLATILALTHDVLLPVGIFVLLGVLFGLEIDLLFVSGILAILGYSVNDTIVVFDRVRENLRINEEKKLHEKFDAVVGRSVSQTISRSINTSLTILVVLVALYFLGSSTTRDFSLLLMIGVLVGTYSSIFLASPLLVTFYKIQTK
jgi:preprotein translocase subunit SecF